MEAICATLTMSVCVACVMILYDTVLSLCNFHRYMTLADCEPDVMMHVSTFVSLERPNLIPVHIETDHFNFFLGYGSQ